MDFSHDGHEVIEGELVDAPRVLAAEPARPVRLICATHGAWQECGLAEPRCVQYAVPVEEPDTRTWPEAPELPERTLTVGEQPTPDPPFPFSPLTPAGAAAVQLHEMYISYVDAGFSKQQAFQLVLVLLSKDWSGSA